MHEREKGGKKIKKPNNEPCEKIAPPHNHKALLDTCSVLRTSHLNARGGGKLLRMFVLLLLLLQMREKRERPSRFQLKKKTTDGAGSVSMPLGRRDSLDEFVRARAAAAAPIYRLLPLYI